MNSTVLVLPLVPVTATTVSGCGPASTAAIRARQRRGSGSEMTGRGGMPRGHDDVRRCKNGYRAAPDGLGDKAAAIDARAGQSREQIARDDFATVGGDAHDVELRQRLVDRALHPRGLRRRMTARGLA